MKKYVYTLLVFLLSAGSMQAQKPPDDYPHDRSTTGCVEGNCRYGFGVYVYDDDDFYAGMWIDGKQEGEGLHFIVDRGPWSDVHVIVGKWSEGKQHGKATYIFPDGRKKEQLWYQGEDVTSRVEKCRSANTAADVYKGFVAVLNGLAAAARGDDVLEGASWGYDAASEQAIPKAVDLTCDQLLQMF